MCDGKHKTLCGSLVPTDVGLVFHLHFSRAVVRTFKPVALLQMLQQSFIGSERVGKPAYTVCKYL